MSINHDHGSPVCISSIIITLAGIPLFDSLSDVLCIVPTSTKINSSEFNATHMTMLRVMMCVSGYSELQETLMSLWVPFFKKYQKPSVYKALFREYGLVYAWV